MPPENANGAPTPEVLQKNRRWLEFLELTLAGLPLEALEAGFARTAG